MVWQKMRKNREVTCQKCGRTVTRDEFDYEEGECYECLFPDMGFTASVPFNHQQGFPRNKTNEDEIYDNRDNVPTNPRTGITPEERKILKKIKGKKSK